MFKKLKAAWNSESSKFGQILHTWVAGILAVASVCSEALTFIGGMPEGTIPMGVRTAIGLGAILSFFVGKLTTKK